MTDFMLEGIPDRWGSIRKITLSVFVFLTYGMLRILGSEEWSRLEGEQIERSSDRHTWAVDEKKK